METQTRNAPSPEPVLIGGEASPVNALARDIDESRVPRSGVRMWWLGQAGFAFKDARGVVTLVDPYLSDACARLHGFKRLSLAPIAADEVRADLVVLTHEHTDHLDPDAIPVIARGNPECLFAAPVGCDEGLEAAGVDPARRARLAPGCTTEARGVTIHSAAADHGDFAPTAVCVLLEFDGVGVLCTGDTSHLPDSFATLYARAPDVILPCINGVFGNMNHVDAAMMVAAARPRFAIPSHFWTFAEQGGGDPGGFVHACAHHAPETRALLLSPGEGFTVERRDT